MPICFSLITISLDLYEFFGHVRGEVSKEIFEYIFCLLSSQTKLNSYGCHLLFLPMQNESVIALNSAKKPLKCLSKSTFSYCVFLLPGQVCSDSLMF